MIEWSEKTLGEITSFISKGIPPKYTEVETVDTIRVLNQKCNRNQMISYNEARLHDNTVKKVPSEKLLREGDVLINSTGAGTAGRVAQIWDILGLTTVDGHMIVLRPTEEMDLLYYGYAIKAYQKKIESLAEGSTGQTEMNRHRLKNEIVIKYPISLKTQHEVGCFLKNLDDKIELNNRINENLRQQLHMFYMKIFSKSTMDTVLGDAVRTTSGGTPSRKHGEYYDHGKICWIKSKELLGGYLLDTEEYINELAVIKSPAKLLPSHSVLIAMYGATVGAYAITSKPMACNQAVCALLSNENYPYTYLFQVACESQQRLINLAVGSAQQNISQVLIKQLLIHSNKESIKKFHSLSHPIHERIEALEAENIQLCEIRDTLLPKLMSGEIDVSNLHF